MARGTWYDHPMNRIFEWIKALIEKYPIAFVVIGGSVTYFIGLTVIIISLASIFPEPKLSGAWVGVTAGSFLIVGFHWLVARYDRRSAFAQILALIPATFLFVCVVVGASLIGVMYQSCTVDADTGEIRACQEGWQFVWERD